MNFELILQQLQDTAGVMADIQQMQAKHLAQYERPLREQEESMRLHEERMAHIDMRLSSITHKVGFMGGFKGPQ
jgi:hypothetical protein